jgi:hypothetical protein
LQLCQQDAVGHDLDEGVVTDPIGESHGVSDGGTDRGVELIGEAFGDRARRESAGLRVTDHSPNSTPRFEKQFRKLRALTRPGVASDDDNGGGGQHGEDVVATGRHR